MTCDECDVDCTNHYIMCDEVNTTFCPYCFDNTPCAKGEHGEGCMTQVFSDGKSDGSPGTG